MLLYFRYTSVKSSVHGPPSIGTFIIFLSTLTQDFTHLPRLNVLIFIGFSVFIDSKLSPPALQTDTTTVISNSRYSHLFFKNLNNLKWIFCQDLTPAQLGYGKFYYFLAESPTFYSMLFRMELLVSFFF